MFQRIRNLKEYLVTRRPPTNFQLNFSVATSFVGLVTGLITLQRFLIEKRNAKERRLDKTVNAAIDKIITKFERTEVTNSLYFISKYQRRVLAAPSFPYSLFYKKPDESEWPSIWYREKLQGKEEALVVENLKKNLKGFFYFLKYSYERNPERKDAFQELLHDDPVNKDIVKKFLKLVEPLDIEKCSKEENCIWERDAPHIYEWLRKIYNIELKD
jgi:hypothetical protein